MKIIKTSLALIIVAAIAVPAYQHFRYHAPTVQPKRCVNASAPCFEVLMTGQPPLLTNGWHHYGGDNCISFTSLPDNQFHGYCGEYKIKRTHKVYP